MMTGKKTLIEIFLLMPLFFFFKYDLSRSWCERVLYNVVIYEAILNHVM